MIESIGVLIDKLIAECVKVGIFEHRKHEERKKPNPDYNKIAEWDRKSRLADEARRMYRNAIDQKLKDILGDKYDWKRDIRTFD